MNTINAHKSCGFAWIWELCQLFTGFYSGHQFGKIVKQFLIRLMSQFSVTSLWKSTIHIPKNQYMWIKLEKKVIGLWLVIKWSLTTLCLRCLLSSLSILPWVPYRLCAFVHFLVNFGRHSAWISGAKAGFWSKVLGNLTILMTNNLVVEFHIVLFEHRSVFISVK